MEALVAVGLAGNAVQFASCVGSLVKETKSIRNSGSTDDLPGLKDLAVRLVYQSGAIKTQLDVSSSHLAEHDEFLRELAVKCETNGGEFLDYLAKLVPTDSRGFLKAARSAIRIKIDWRVIEDFIINLERLRDDLTLATIRACRESMSNNHTEVIAHLELIQANVKAHDVQQDANQVAIQVLSDKLRDWHCENRQIVSLEIDRCIAAIHRARPDLQHPRPSSLRLQGVEGEICSWLDFRQNLWRFNTVDKAYSHTCEWIFKAPDQHKTWDDFSKYLQGDDAGPYFINGKAGSGKSTLMKHLVGHQATTTALNIWVPPNSELMTMHFFFWNSGTALQKTHEGMLRSLLHTALDKHPELVPVVFRSLYRTWDGSAAKTQPDYIELKAALSLLLAKATYLRFAIFIDGIDEFEGDHNDMVSFLRDLTSNSHVKMVVSSRPINTCLRILRGCPSLRLQDLTRKDMKIFVRKELGSQKDLLALVDSQHQSLRLQAAILDKASGVFLWVKLAVRVLINRIQDGADFVELFSVLDSLHSDLEVFYQEMFTKLRPEYQTQAAQIFRLVEFWTSLYGESIPALTLSFALNQIRDLITRSNVDRELGRLDRLIRSRCVGLLEVAGLTDWESLDDTKVDYHHLSVPDFLKQDKIWQVIEDLTPRSNFDPGCLLIEACLSTTDVRFHAKSSGPLESQYAFKIMHLCRNVQSLTPEETTTYLQAMRVPPSWLMRLRDDVQIPETSRPSLDDLESFAASQALPFVSSRHTTNLRPYKRVTITTSALYPWRHPYNLRPTQSQRQKCIEHHIRNTMPANALTCDEWYELLPPWEFAALELQNDHEKVAELVLAYVKAAKLPQEVWAEMSKRDTLERSGKQVRSGEQAVPILARILQSLQEALLQNPAKGRLAYYLSQIVCLIDPPIYKPVMSVPIVLSDIAQSTQVASYG